MTPEHTHRSTASNPDYKHLAEKFAGRHLYDETWKDLEEANSHLRTALARHDSSEDDDTALGPSVFTPKQLEDALDALARYEWFLCKRVAPLLPEDSLNDRFYENWADIKIDHNPDN